MGWAAGSGGLWVDGSGGEGEWVDEWVNGRAVGKADVEWRETWFGSR